MLKPSAPPQDGETAVAIDNALGLVTNNITEGNASKVEDDYFYTSAPISNGNSGGPLVDKDGRVLGVADTGGAATFDTPVVENLNTAVRLSALCSTLLSGTPCADLH